MVRSLQRALISWSLGALGLASCAPATPEAQTAAAGPALEATRVKSIDEMQARAGGGIDPETHPGRNLFLDNCASCHMGGVPKAPDAVWLEMLAPDSILSAMNGGIMSQQAAHLKPAERQLIAEYLTRTPLANYQPPAPPAQCKDGAAGFDWKNPPARWGWGHDTRRFIPGDVAGLTASQIPSLKVKWAFAYPKATRARSQPTVGWNSLFVGSQNGTVYAFDLDSGCVRWSYRASAEVRTTIVADPDTRTLYFGDVLARAYALDAATGRLLWQTKVDDHGNATITGTPALGPKGMLYVPISSLEVTSAADPKYACCTFRGALAAIDRKTGSILWKTHTVEQEPREQGRTSVGTPILGPSGAPVWGSPLYDAASNRVYFGSGENYSSPADLNSDAVFAVDAMTGKRLWRTQLTAGDAWNVGCMMGNENCPKENGPDVDLSASLVMVPLKDGRRMLVAGQKSGVAYGIHPDTGAIIWSQRAGHGGTQGGIHFGMAVEGQRVYLPVNDMDDTRDARVYDETQHGAGIHAIDAATGKFVWRRVAENRCGDRPNCDPGVSAAVTAIPGVVFAGHMDGMFRAYDGATGKTLWEYDTTQGVPTITGDIGHGGGMSGPGATVYKGHVVLNSGYGMYYHMPGNLLLVMTPDGK